MSPCSHHLVASFFEACLEAASSPLIGLMDADDRGDPERFARLLEALNKNPDWDGACSAVRIFGSVSEAIRALRQKCDSCSLASSQGPCTLSPGDAS